MICEHKAKKDKDDLHFRFWLSKKWSAYFRNQIASANKLLKEFPDKAIIRALASSETQRIYSLRAPHLRDIIKKYEEIIDQENKNLTKEFERKENKNYRKSYNKKNILSRLEEIDNEP